MANESFRASVKTLFDYTTKAVDTVPYDHTMDKALGYLQYVAERMEKEEKKHDK